MYNGDEFRYSYFRSALEGPWMWPPTEVATADLKPIGEFLPPVLELWVSAFDIAPSCESPIEVELGARLTVALRSIEGSPLALVPQYVLARYRYDFAITRDGKLVGLVECDGKEFHSTEDQIRNDRAKDRLAAEKGVPIFRFSGSEIYSNGKACVRLILHALRGHMTQKQWETVDVFLAPRPWYKGDDPFESDEDEYEMA